MKFRSPTETPVHLSLTSGHTMLIGPDPVDVPEMFARVAVAEGCVSDSPLVGELSDASRVRANILDEEAKKRQRAAERTRQLLQENYQGIVASNDRDRQLLVDERAEVAKDLAHWSQMSRQDDPDKENNRVAGVAERQRRLDELNRRIGDDLFDGAVPDPQRRLAALRASGGEVKLWRGKWRITGINALEAQEQGRPRASQKTIRADLIEAAEAEKREGSHITTAASPFPTR